MTVCGSDRNSRPATSTVDDTQSEKDCRSTLVTRVRAIVVLERSTFPFSATAYVLTRTSFQARGPNRDQACVPVVGIHSGTCPQAVQITGGHRQQMLPKPTPEMSKTKVDAW